MSDVFIRRRGTAVPVPMPGMTRTASALYVGGAEILRVERTAEGETYAEEVIPGGGSSGGDECSNHSFGADSSKWSEPMEWYYRSNTWPSDSPNATFQGVVQDLVDGHDNWALTNNVCGHADTLDIGHIYRGDLDHPSRIDTEGRCGQLDGINMVDFGVLSNSPDDPLAVNCSAASGSTRVESDTKFERWIYDWFDGAVPAGCSWEFSVEAVMTHEAGHTWGLNHVSEQYNSYMTMSEATSDCDRSPVTLGIGDIDGGEFLGY